MLTAIGTFLIGVFIGTFIVGFFFSVNSKEEIEKAYKKGRADEKASIIEKVERQYGGNDNG